MMTKEVFDILITKRKIIKNPLKVGNRLYTQYKLTLPKQFVEAYNTDTVYFIADSIGLIAPNEDVLEKVLAKLPEIRRLVKEMKKNEQ